MDKAEPIRNLLAPTVQALGFELWGVEHESGSTPVVLRIYIDHADGITVDDCGAVSEQVSALLDVEEPIRGEYILEVSSPGIERPLFTAEQYRRYVGAEVKVRLAWPEHGRRNFRGRLLGAEDAQMVVEMDGEIYRLPYAAVARARLLEPGISDH